MLIDLHVHSTGSDGSLTVDELLKKAEKRQIKLFSITDHDVLTPPSGAIPEDIIYLPGLEISAEFSSTLHILGYGIDINHKALSSIIKELQLYRQERNLLIIQNMNKMGIPVSFEDVQAIAGNDGIVGRPHFGKYMVMNGHAKSLDDAFKRYFTKGAQLYENKKRLDPQTAIQLIRSAGGIAVLAHPFQLNLSVDELDVMIQQFIDYGLNGIEIYYPCHRPDQIEVYRTLAETYGLVITAGSDFHGENKEANSFGMEMPDEEVQYLMKALRRTHALTSVSTEQLNK